jgi:hypothetical protein
MWQSCRGALQALQSPMRKPKTLVLSVYTGANETEPIVEDVVAQVYPRR